MNPPPRSRPRQSPWLWPSLLGTGGIFALVAALVADGSVGWEVVCWALLLTPIVVIVRALWPGDPGS